MKIMSDKSLFEIKLSQLFFNSGAPEAINFTTILKWF